MSQIRRGQAIAHDGTAVQFVVGGIGQRWLFLGLSGATAQSAESQAPWLEALGSDYRLIFIDYPGEPKLYTLTPPTVARDYLAIADAAGADRFAYYGYSWGAVSGLQLALRTDRLTAFIAGGFPMIGGPYAAMLRVCRRMEQGPLRMGPYDVPWAPESARQFITYYEGLRTFDDRAAQARLTCPRLTFVGTADDIPFDDEVVRIGQTVVDSKSDLEAAGWEAQLLEGLNHWEAAAPGVAVPLIKAWLAGRATSDRAPSKPGSPA